ncbi:unnamed protein product [Caenorhabditis auriculariae]|uniref:Uncharacterized protein n=1 Tax=Caenorhabditis auriculariae TaxID=2777116 RepID=A0A8S1HU04_9PELO|nr:unnamed protein product [Caenorhabditis auriculariae]
MRISTATAEIPGTRAIKFHEDRGVLTDLSTPVGVLPLIRHDIVGARVTRQRSPPGRDRTTLPRPDSLFVPLHPEYRFYAVSRLKKRCDKKDGCVSTQPLSGVASTASKMTRQFH